MTSTFGTIERNLDYYILLGTAEGQEKLKSQAEQGGYDVFRKLLDQLEAVLKAAEEDRFDEVELRLASAAQLFPVPGLFSPTWQNIWEEFQGRLRWKRYAFESVTAPKREGEWQIIIDNPYTNNEIVCYPALSFLEAAYLFGYFKANLEKNEYLRLQKVITSIEITGETD